MTPTEKRTTLGLLGWVQCGRAFYKILPDGYLHATVAYPQVLRVWADVADQGWAEPLPMDNERLNTLYHKVMAYERTGNLYADSY